MDEMTRRNGKSGPNGAAGGQLVAQPHGGAIRRGSQSGSTPGAGRPPAAIRATCRALFDQAVPKLRAIVYSRTARHVDRIRASDVLGKYGMTSGATIGVDDVREGLRQQSEVIRETLPAEQAEALLTRIRAIWLGL